MFKKLVVGGLATGIMLSGAGGAMAATPNTDSSKTEKVTMAADKKNIKLTGYLTRNAIPSETVLYGIKWYLKDAWQEPNGTWTGYFEGWY
ncbi:lysine 2,3-aminomutase [Bacillus cereus]|uniref:lysine 2,3-aminomutase n=1 Tax=Bacillus paramycoides TaxID=2026194 RepID=UPI000BF29177|nr:lysine 2,3-aminomutase [Bacillus paramycoides]PFD33589.1 lysine 2,3-aminomutase [Bacillus cereus]PGM53209.1 lysine 2,3-aminomutase [Bacillus cereus]